MNMTLQYLHHNLYVWKLQQKQIALEQAVNGTVYTIINDRINELYEFEYHMCKRWVMGFNVGTWSPEGFLSEIQHI